MRTTLLIAAALLFTLAPLHALDDTPENRLREAKRYLATNDTRAMIETLALQMAEELPEARREELIRRITDRIDVAALEQTMLDAMVAVFTAGELAALADFWGSDVGRSAMGKMGLYMARVMPGVQRAIGEAVEGE